MRPSICLFLAASLATLGCAASPPPPPAQALRLGDPRVTTRWEQFCEQSQSVSQASWLASSRGVDGWELVSMYAGVLCYKRPVNVEPPPMSPPASAPVMVGVRSPMPVSTITVPSVIDPGF